MWNPVLNLALAKHSRVLLPRVSSLTTKWRNYILVQVSQLLEGLEVGVKSCADAMVSGTIDDLLLKASQLEHSSEEPAMNPRRSLHNRLLL